MAHRRDPAEPNDDDDEPEVVIDSHTRTGCKAPAPAYIHPAIPAAVARVIVVTPRALSQLQTSPSPSNDNTPQKNATAIHPAVFLLRGVRNWCARSPRQKIPAAVEHTTPSPTVTLAPPHLILVQVYNTQTWI